MSDLTPLRLDFKKLFNNMGAPRTWPKGRGIIQKNW